MSNQSLGNRVLEQLTQALDSGRLPASVVERAEQLLARLHQPVRIGIFGKPGAGKSTLVNLLLGREVLPEDATLPTTQISYGDTAGAVCTIPDGTKLQLPTANAYDIADLKPVFVEIRMPLPALKKISVLEVVTPNDPTSIHRASQWAAKRCELAIWCTEAFDTNEQAIWAQMPDVLKDHSFLMLTKADLRTADGSLDQILEATRAISADEFNQIMPIAALDAIDARDLNGNVDKAKMRKSGALALISAVLKQTELGRQSDIDMADVLLHQHQDVLGDVVEEPTEEVPINTDADVLEAVIGATVLSRIAPIPEPQALSESEPAIAAAPVPEPVQEDAILAPEEPAEEPIAAPEPATAAEPAPEPAEDVVTLHPATRDAYQQALEYIATHSRAMVDLADELGEAAPSQIIAETVEHVQWLSDHLNDHGDDSDDSLHRARDTAFDATDLVQLMQMEKRDSAAIEAVSVLLQIKHELQADLAA